MMKTTIIIILAFSFSTLTGQESSLKERALLVEKEYDNEIYNVNPLFDYASITTSKRSKLDFGADSLSRLNIFTPDLDVSIKPVAYQRQFEESGKHGFIKGDYGTLNPLHAQAGYTYSLPNYFNLTADFQYDNRKDQTVEHQQVRTAGGSLGFDYYLTNALKTNINVAYNDNKFGLYSGIQTPLNEGDDFNNAYNKLSIQLGASTFRSLPSNWNFGWKARFTNWSNQITEGTERNIQLQGHVDIQVTDVWGFFVKPSYQISKSDEYSDANALAGSFRITYNQTHFYSRTGVRVDYFNDQIMWWPDADIRWNVTNRVSLNIGSSARTVIQGAEATSDINPYVLVSENKFISYFKGIDLEVKSAISEDASLHAKVTYLNAQNDLNFVLSPEDVRRFSLETVAYERQRVEMGYQHEHLNDAITTGLTLQYDRYSKNMRSLLHRPTLSILPSVQANLLDNRLKVAITGIFNNPQTIDRIPSARLSTNWRRDVSSTITFSINDHLNLNLNADNIFDADYQVWNGYNNFGRNLSGGLLLKF